jgi:hypothetical protein
VRHPLYTLTNWCLTQLPVDPAGRRCVDETLADWRKEASQSSGPLAALIVPARALWSVLRCLTMVSLRDIRSREGAVLLLRLAGLSIVCMLALIGFRWDDSIVIDGTRVPIGPAPVVLLSVASVLGVMPFLVFASSAIGRRLSTATRLGPALVAGVLMLVAMGWILPAANQSFRQLVFGLHANGPIPPGINERSLVELIAMLFTENTRQALVGLNVRIVFVVAVPVMLVIGTTTRQLRGWRRGVGSVLPVLLLLCPFAIGLNGYVAVAWWPALMAAVLITRALVTGSRTDDLVGNPPAPLVGTR